MLRVTLWHEPQYFQFFIQDPAADTDLLVSKSTYGDLKLRRFACGNGITIVRVRSEYTRIPIAVEFDADGLAREDFGKWDHVVECSLETRTKEIVFAGCPDGPIHGAFGTLAVAPGRYRLRIHYGGQNTVQPDGETGDFYLVQVWPSNESDSEILKDVSGT